MSHPPDLLAALADNRHKMRIVAVIAMVLAALGAGGVIFFIWVVPDALWACIYGISFGCLSIFTWQFWGWPFSRYSHVILDALKGRYHTENYLFEYIEDMPLTREGVKVYTVHFSQIRGPGLAGRDTGRQLFWLADRPWPPLKPGEAADVTYSGHIILEIESQIQ